MAHLTRLAQAPRRSTRTVAYRWHTGGIPERSESKKRRGAAGAGSSRSRDRCHARNSSAIGGVPVGRRVRTSSTQQKWSMRRRYGVVADDMARIDRLGRGLALCPGLTLSMRQTLQLHGGPCVLSRQQAAPDATWWKGVHPADCVRHATARLGDSWCGDAVCSRVESVT